MRYPSALVRTNFVLGPLTLMTRRMPIVLTTTPPQPASKARMMLESDSVGGAEASRNGFSNSMPVNPVESVVFIMTPGRRIIALFPPPSPNLRPPLWYLPRMPRTVKGGLIQVRADISLEGSTDDVKRRMIDKHLPLVEEAGKKGVQVMCLQELFYGPYFCAEQKTRCS